MVRAAVRFAVARAGLAGAVCGEGLGSPWIRSRLAFDFFPVALAAAHLAGILAGRFSASPAGAALAAEEAAAHEAVEAEARRERRRGG